MCARGEGRGGASVSVQCVSVQSAREHVLHAETRVDAANAADLIPTNESAPDAYAPL